MVMDEPQNELFFLNWCPVNILPIDNLVHTSAIFARGERRSECISGIKALFEAYPKLLLLEYAIRLDGVFMLRTVFRPGPYQDRLQAPRDISNFIKISFGHKHEFHSYPYEQDDSPNTKARAAANIILYFPRLVNRLWRKISHSSDYIHCDLDYDLHIDPVRTENPFSNSYKQRTDKEFESLEQILDPCNEKDNLNELRCFQASGSESIEDAPRALLKLRKLYAIRKDRCLLAYERRKNKWANSVKVPLLYGFITTLIVLWAMFIPMAVGPKTSLAVSIIAGFAALIVIDHRIQAPKLEVIQRSIGYFTYANTYSKLTEALFYGMAANKSVNNNTGNFDNLLNGLEARFLIEKQVIDNRKYLWVVAFTLLTITLALAKIAVELER